MTKIENEMLNAVAAYSGSVKRCRPGKARGADLPKKTTVLSNGSTRIAVMCPYETKMPSVGSDEWRVPNASELKNGMHQCGSVTG